MRTILFVCPRNAGRSMMAEVLFNKLAKGKVKAISAGTEPADTVDPKVVEVMREIGIELKDRKPQALTPKMLKQADLVVTVGCSVKGLTSLDETEDWTIEDIAGKPIEKVREVRDDIKTKVTGLVARLSRGMGNT